MELEVKGAAHCSAPGCGQLDFLPFNCDACGRTFCKDHIAHAQHSCPRAQKTSAQVVLCPICNQSIRILPGEDPNVTWDRHFNSTCTRRVPAKKGPSRCPVQGCREQVGLSNRYECQRCGMTVCLRHRMEEDHPCDPRAKGGSKSGRSQPVPGIQWGSNGSSSRPQAASQSGLMSEDERLAHELQRQELEGRGARQPATGRGKKVTDRFMSMLACFKTTKTKGDDRSRFLEGRGRGSSSSSSRR